MLTGPYHAPTAMAQRPLMALFWAVIAPTLIMYAVVFAANLVSGGWALDVLQDAARIKEQWLVYTLAHFALFAAMTLWSTRIGAGPFGGPIRADADWLAIAALTGPIVLLGTSALTSALFSNGEPDWIYRDGANTDLVSHAALSASMIVFTVILAPIVEEVAFRGLGMGCLLARGWSPVAATLLTTAIFTSLHMQYVPTALIPIFIVGLYLGALRVLSGSLAAPLIAHIAANGVSMAIFISAGP